MRTAVRPHRWMLEVVMGLPPRRKTWKDLVSLAHTPTVPVPDGKAQRSSVKSIRQRDPAKPISPWPA